MVENKNLHRDVTFVDSKLEVIQRWFPYLEGFAEDFVIKSIKHLNIKPEFIYEPFAGSGTVPIYCLKNNINCFYDEVNPFMVFLVNTKMEVLRLSSEVEFESLIKLLIDLKLNYSENLENISSSETLQQTYKDTFNDSVYFTDINLELVLKSKTFIESIPDSIQKRLFLIALSEALLPSSRLKRAGDIRYRRSEKEFNEMTNYRERTLSNLDKIIDDLSFLSSSNNRFTARIDYGFNAKNFKQELDGLVDFTFTSPPYLNGTNYIRNTKLELWFNGILKNKSDLSHYRSEVVTAGINDVTTTIKDLEIPYIESKLINKDLWYDRRIPKMIRDYFFDMNIVFDNVYKYSKKGSYFCIDIGDSIYGGVHIPTDKILLELLKNNGFNIIESIKLRDRKSKKGAPLTQQLLICQK